MISRYLMRRFPRIPQPCRWVTRLTIGCLCLGGLFPQPVGAIAASTDPIPPPESLPAPTPAAPLRPASNCPDELTALTAGLVRDLSSYANRVAYRNFGKFRGIQRPSTIILVSQPDFEPLAIESRSYTATPVAEDGVDQVFLTTLERQYNRQEAIELQHFHWVFLTQAESGWYLAFMLSSLGAYPPVQPLSDPVVLTAPPDLTVQPPTPPRDSSNGLLAEAIRLWLRDCRAGAVYPVESNEPDRE